MEGSKPVARDTVENGARWLLPVALIASGLVPVEVQAAQQGRHGGEWEPRFQYAPLSDQHSIASLNTGMVSVGDLDGDQVTEVVLASDGYNASVPALVCVNGATGDLEWIFEYFPQFGSLSPVLSGCIIELDDLNGDGVPEVLCGDSSSVLGNLGSHLRGAVFIHSGFDGSLIWYASASDWGDRVGVGAAALDDLDGDGVGEFAVSVLEDELGSWDSAVHVFSGQTRSHLRTLPFNSSVSLGSLTLGKASSKVDLDFDGLGDLVIPVGKPGFSYGTSVVSSATGLSLVWLPGLVSDYNTPSVVSYVQDLDSDGIPEIALRRSDGKGVSLFSTQSGAQLWTQELGDAPAATSMCSVGDLNGDRVDDLAVGSPLEKVNGFPGRGKVHFLCGATGERIRRILCGVSGDRGSDRFGANLFWDRTSATLFARSDYGYLGTDSRPIVGLQFSPFLELDQNEISATSGGRLDAIVDFPDEFQVAHYALLVSSKPGETVGASGVIIPLGTSKLLRDTVLGRVPPWFTGGVGTLDSLGDASVTLTIPKGALAPLTGSSVWFAAVAGGSRQDVQVSSIAVELAITP